MGAIRNIATGVVASALIASSITPVMARGFPFGGGGGSPFGGGGHGGGGHSHGDDDVGAVIAGALGFGALIAVVSAVTSNNGQGNQNSRNDYPNNAPPPPPPPPPVSYNGYSQQRQGGIASENEAVDACAVATEQQAGRSASVRDIRDVRPNGNGWDVNGVVEARNSYRSQSGELHNFRCSVSYGAVQSVRIDEGVAYNN